VQSSDGLLARHEIHSGSCWLREYCDRPACRQTFGLYRTIERDPATDRVRAHCHAHIGEVANGHKSPVRLPEPAG
jgi:hypothetical protein